MMGQKHEWESVYEIYFASMFVVKPPLLQAYVVDIFMTCIYLYIQDKIYA